MHILMPASIKHIFLWKHTQYDEKVLHGLAVCWKIDVSKLSLSAR